jgi:hypothetical protein
VQRDPNQSGVPAVRLAMSGSAAGLSAAAFNLEGMLGDGFNLYGYLGGNPINNTDPMGLSFANDFLSGTAALDHPYLDRFQRAMARRTARMTRHTIPVWEQIDAVIMQHQASKAAILDSFGLGVEAAQFYVYAVAQLVPGVSFGMSLTALLSGEGDGWDVAEVGMSAAGMAVPGGGLLSKIMSSTGKLLSKVGADYIAAAGARGVSAVRRGLRHVDCFTSFSGETLVLTAEGEIPIELVQVGDLVLAQCEWDSSAPPEWRPVTHVFCDGPKAVMTVLFGSGESFVVTLDHEIWVETRGWLLARDLAPGMLVRLADGGVKAVEAVWLEREPRRVYNLEVEGAHTYFAGGVWVHNACLTVSQAVRRLTSASHGAADVLVATKSDAIKVVSQAFPDLPLRGFRHFPRKKYRWEFHPPDNVAMDLPHIKYWDWRPGKHKNDKGRKGHIFYERNF